MPNYLVTYLIEDDERHKSQMRLRGVFADDAAANVAALNLANFIQPIILGSLYAYTYQREAVRLDFTTPPTPAANSEVEIKARFIFNAANAFTTQILVPTYNHAFSIPNSNLVDRLNLQVEEFINETINGGWSDSVWSDLVSLDSVKEAYGKRRR